VAAISIAAYARRRGCSRQTVYNAVNDGRITLTPEGRVEPEQADAEWESTTRTPAASSGVPAFAAARARTEAARAERMELRVQVERGDLVPAAEAQRLYFGALRYVRDRVLALPSLADELHAVAHSHADVSLARHAMRERLAEAVQSLLDDAAAQARGAGIAAE
jgi:hypothetical protein